MQKNRPTLGHVYALPLLTGTFACGWIRAMSKEHILFVVFKKVFTHLPSNIENLNVQQIFNFFFMRKDSFMTSKWKDLGNQHCLEIDSWPLPLLCEGTSKTRLCKYDNALNVVESKLASEAEQLTYPYKSITGPRALLDVLTRFLDDGLPPDFRALEYF